jgi:ankyrin repeat protein
MKPDDIKNQKDLLATAVHYENIEIVEELLKDYFNELDFNEKYLGKTALGWALYYSEGFQEKNTWNNLIKEILKKMKFNGISFQKDLLAVAVYHENIEFVKELLKEQSNNINVKEEYENRIALFYALKNEKDSKDSEQKEEWEKISKTIFGKMNSDDVQQQKDLLAAAVFYKNIEIVKELLESYSEYLDFNGKYGINTALDWARYYKDLYKGNSKEKQEWTGIIKKIEKAQKKQNK